MELIPDTEPEFDEVDNDESQEIIRAQTDPALLALHESGHAVLAENCGMPVVKVVAKGFGSSFTEVTEERTSLENLHQKLVVAFGGFCAVFKKTNNIYIANIHCVGGYENDYARMGRFFDEVKITDEKERATWSKKAKAAAEQLIEKHWGEVEQIAEILCRDREIPGEQVRKILGKA